MLVLATLKSLNQSQSPILKLTEKIAVHKQVSTNINKLNKRSKEELAENTENIYFKLILLNVFLQVEGLDVVFHTLCLHFALYDITCHLIFISSCFYLAHFIGYYFISCEE